MIDKKKTDFLRKKILELRETTVEKTQKLNNQQNAINVLVGFFLRYLVFYGAQHYVMIKYMQVPFTLWESLIIYLCIKSFLLTVKNPNENSTNR